MYVRISHIWNSDRCGSGYPTLTGFHTTCGNTCNSVPDEPYQDGMWECFDSHISHCNFYTSNCAIYHNVFSGWPAIQTSSGNVHIWGCETCPDEMTNSFYFYNRWRNGSIWTGGRVQCAYSFLLDWMFSTVVDNRHICISAHGTCQYALSGDPHSHVSHCRKGRWSAPLSSHYNFLDLQVFLDWDAMIFQCVLVEHLGSHHLSQHWSRFAFSSALSSVLIFYTLYRVCSRALWSCWSHR